MSRRLAGPLVISGSGVERADANEALLRDRRRRGGLLFSGDAKRRPERAERHCGCVRGRFVDHGGIERADAIGKTVGADMGAIRWDRVAEGLGCHGRM